MMVVQLGLDDGCSLAGVATVHCMWTILQELWLGIGAPVHQPRLPMLSWLRSVSS